MSVFSGKRRRVGMSLSETLVAVLIFALVSVGVATGITSAVKVYHDSTRTSEAQTLCSSLSEEIIYILHNSTDAADSAAAPTFTNAAYGSDVSFAAVEGKIVVGGKQILGSGAYTDLKAGISCSCANSLFDVTLTVTDAADKSLATQTFKVKVPDK